jgi:hypothetical protein
MDSDKQPKKPPVSRMQLLGITGEFAYLIGVPLVVGILAGKWLDEKYSTHFFVIIGILLALAVSSFGIYRAIVRILDDLRR